AIFHQLDVIGHLAGELDLAAKGTALAGLADPAEEEAGHLPDRVEPEAAGHDGIADEMALEEPQVGIDVEFGPDLTLVESAAGFVDMGDAVEHQHGRRRQARIHLTGQFTPAMRQQLFITKCVLSVRHYPSP